MILASDLASTHLMLSVLKILMEKATTYSWSSVRNFYQSLATAIEQARLQWADIKIIQEKASNFFSHADLRSNSQHARSSQPNNKAPKANNKEAYCKEWNYRGSCACDKTNSACVKSSTPCLAAVNGDFRFPTLRQHRKMPPTDSSYSRPRSFELLDYQISWLLKFLLIQTFR